MTTATTLHSWVRDSLRPPIGALLLASAVVLAACGPPPSERPREGAPAIVVGPPAGKENGSASPPTLAPPAALGNVPPTLITPAQPSPSGLLSASPSPSPSPVPGYVIVATDGAGANMRTGPSTSASVITTVREGTAVEVLGDPVTVDGRAWRQIRAGGRDGWVVAVVVRPR